jgi:hypothetical protein
LLKVTSGSSLYIIKEWEGGVSQTGSDELGRREINTVRDGRGTFEEMALARRSATFGNRHSDLRDVTALALACVGSFAKVLGKAHPDIISQAAGRA